MNYLINNDFIQFEFILFNIIIISPLFKKIPKLIFKNNDRINYWELKLSQYTNWNIFIIIIENLLNYYNINNNLLIEFIAINSISICISFHLIYLKDYTLFYKFPKANGMSILEFNICSFVTHILPTFVYLQKFNNINHTLCKTSLYYTEINIGVYTLLFKLMWCFSCLKDFEISKIYSKDHSYLNRIVLKIFFIIHFFTGLTFSMLKNNYSLKYIDNNDP